MIQPVSFAGRGAGLSATRRVPIGNPGNGVTEPRLLAVEVRAPNPEFVQKNENDSLAVSGPPLANDGSRGSGRVVSRPVAVEPIPVP